MDIEQKVCVFISDAKDTMTFIHPNSSGKDTCAHTYT